MHSRNKLLAAVAVAMAIAGCAGSDGTAGADGAQGPRGAAGATGPTGPVATTSETCVLCHGPGKIVQTNTLHNLPFASGTQQNTVVTIASVDADAAGSIAVTFSVADPDGNVATCAKNELMFLLGSFDATTATTGGTGFWNRYAQERVSRGVSTLNGFVDNGDGTYTYTSKASLLSASAGAAGTVQRILFGVSKVGWNAGNAVFHFARPAAFPAAAMASVADPKLVVATATCNRCHVDRIADVGHGGSRNTSESCQICHSPLTTGTNWTGLHIDYASMVHQVHAAINAKPINNPVGGGWDWSKITFPADVKDCELCHQPGPGAPQSGNYASKPNRQACGSCHTNVNFDTGANHPVGDVQTDDTACAGCHTVAKIKAYHTMDTFKQKATALQAEYVVSISMSPPTTPPFYVAGETPTITVQLLTSTMVPLPNTFYGLGQDRTAAGTNSGVQNGRLTTAGLYVYGPRTLPKPVFTAGAATNAQRTSLFIQGAATDPNILTTTTGALPGFKYKITIPTGTKAGTYFARFYAQDYGYVSDTNYRVSSNGFMEFQVGTATPDLKVAGDCTRCHGNYNLTPHNARHAVVFNTDECNSCHDQSGNHADPLGNRIHAAHAGAAIGDQLDVDWSTSVSYSLSNGKQGGPITYPVGARNGEILNCAVCHSSGSTQYRNATGTAMMCGGCHASLSTLSRDHMLQNGGKFTRE